jgi:hypothetical protein
LSDGEEQPILFVGQSRSELLDLLTLWIESITHATVSVGIRARIQPSNICFALKGLGVIISYDCLTGAGLWRDVHKPIAIRLAHMKMLFWPTLDLCRGPK